MDQDKIGKEKENMELTEPLRKKLKTFHVYCQIVFNPVNSINLINLPKEVIFNVFDHLDVKSLSRVTIASKSLRDLVDGYCVGPRFGYQRIIPRELQSNGCTFLHPDDDNDGDITRHIKFFRDLGLFVKRLTCLYPTDERLNIMITFMDKVTSGLPDHWSMRKWANNNQAFVLKCFGNFLHTMIIGWEESECIKVFLFLENIFQLDQVVTTVLNSHLGEKNWCEYFIRCFYHQICLDRLRKKDDQLFWLSMILEKHSYHETIEFNPVLNKAKLLTILFGPLVQEDDQGSPMIAWWELTSSFFLKQLNPLGYHVQIFQSKWSDQEIFDIINSITNLPDQWSPENVSSLLHYCGERIVKLKIQSLFLDGDIAQTTNALVYQTLVVTKLDISSNCILDLIDECFTTQAANELKWKLILELPGAFNEAFAEIDHLVDVDEERDSDDLHDMVNAMTSLMGSLLNRSYQCPVSSNPVSPSPPLIVQCKYSENVGEE